MAGQGGGVRLPRGPRAPDVPAGGGELARLQLVRVPVSALLTLSSLQRAVAPAKLGRAKSGCRFCTQQSEPRGNSVVAQWFVPPRVIRAPQEALADSFVDCLAGTSAEARFWRTRWGSERLSRRWDLPPLPNPTSDTRMQQCPRIYLMHMGSGGQGSRDGGGWHGLACI